MAIIISENGKDAKRIDESQFGLEDKLQQYIYDNPDAIPLYDIDEDTRLFIAAREFNTKSGPIDALGFDANGNIYVVETKLYKNPDKRTVVAQALDYGASLWRHAVNFEDFESRIDEHCQKEFTNSFRQAYADFFELDDATDNIATIRSNLHDGSIKFVVLMDKLHDALKDLVIFVNQNSRFDLYAVELEYYKHKSFEIIIPKIYGAEVKKEVSTSKKTGTNVDSEPCDEETFLNILKLGQYDKSALTVKQAVQIHELNKILSTKTGGRIEYYKSKRGDEDFAKSFFLDEKYNYEFESNGMLSYFFYEKKSPMVNVLRDLYSQVISKGLFGKSDQNIKSSRLYISPNQMSKSSEIDEFIAIYRSLLDELNDATL